MANQNWPNGFIPSEDEQCTREHEISATNAEIAYGDLVERHTDGYVRPAVASSVRIIGVAAEHKAANSGGTIKVYDDPETVFVAQMDDSSFSAQADLQYNYDIVVTTPDSAGRSRMQIDASTKALTATLPIKVRGLVPITNAYGNTLGAYARVYCLINNHIYKSTGVIG